MSATNQEELVPCQQAQHEAATTAEAAESSSQQESQQPEGCSSIENEVDLAAGALETEACQAHQQQQHDSQACTSSSGSSSDNASKSLK
jgi:hypothetical protein